MSNENNNEQDTTSKPGDGLNVNPSGTSTDSQADNQSDTQGDESTSNSGATDMSGGENEQAAVQKHAELRKEAERKMQEAEDARKQAESRLQGERETRIQSSLKSAIEGSNIPQPVKERFAKDPIKFFIANQTEDKEWDWDTLSQTVDNVENLNNWTKDIESTYGVANVGESSNSSDNTDNNSTPGQAGNNFADRDVPHQTESPADNSGEVTPERIKEMSPYEIAQLPEDVRNRIKEAGGIPE